MTYRFLILRAGEATAIRNPPPVGVHQRVVNEETWGVVPLKGQPPHPCGIGVPGAILASSEDGWDGVSPLWPCACKRSTISK
jgi:hypothetical protein